MKKLFTLAAAVLASVGMWAAYAPTADEVIILKDVYDANATDAGYSTHAAIAWGGTVSFSDKKAGDPNNNGEATSSNVKTCSVKGNGNGKNLTVSFEGCSQIIVYHEKQSSRYVELRADSKAGDLLGKSVGNTYYTAVDLNANNSYSIFLHGVKDDGGDQDFYIYAVKLIKGETCTNPEFTVSPTEGTGFVGDPIDITVSSKNQSKPINSKVTVDGVEGVYGTDYTFSVSTGLVQATPLKAGTFEITFSQASNGTYCDAKETVTFVISEKTPVTAVTIDGPTAGYVGQEFVYTATAEGATTYEWYVDGVAANNNSATFNYTAVKGNHAIKATATNEFTATPVESNTINVAVTSLYGELIAFTAETGSSSIDKDITATGIVGGTVHQKSAKDGKLNTNNYYSLKLTTGNFLAGDTVKVTQKVVNNYVSSTLALSSTQDNTDIIGEVTGITVPETETVTTPIVLTKDAAMIYLSRAGDYSSMNPTVTSMSVVRPMPVKSTVETLTAVTINNLAIEASDLAELVSAGEIILTKAYVNAPVVKFTKQVVITYEDDSQKVISEGIEVTSQQAQASMWGASAKIGGNTYTVYTVKPLSYTVTYKFGEETLGSENVVANGTPDNYEDYQKLDDGGLSTFNGWYSDADLENAVTIASEVITQNTTFYASFTYKYAESINIEKWIMTNGAGKGNETKTMELIHYMGSLKYAKSFEWDNGNLELDSLNNSKSDGLRNYAYLGLKVKKAGSQFRARLTPGSTIKIKFGAYKAGSEPTVSINHGEATKIAITDNVYSYTANGDELLTFKMTTADAVVLQQIAINEELAAPELFAISCAATENGTLEAPYKLGIPGETVALTVEPAAGYVVSGVSLNGEPIAADGEGKYSFEMPAAAANVAATFSVATSIDNTEDAVKAVKVIRNGQLFIEKNGKTYNALGAEVK